MLRGKLRSVEAAFAPGGVVDLLGQAGWIGPSTQDQGHLDLLARISWTFQHRARQHCPFAPIDTHVSFRSRRLCRTAV